MKRRHVLIAGLSSLASATVPAAWAGTLPGSAICCAAALRLLSATRWEAGLCMTVSNPNLVGMARKQAAHMAQTGHPSHLGPDGDDPAVRGRQRGFVGRVLGETLAETPESPAATMVFWLAHPPTREVLMDPDARAHGFAAIRGCGDLLWLSFVTGA